MEAPLPHGGARGGGSARATAATPTAACATTAAAATTPRGDKLVRTARKAVPLSAEEVEVLDQMWTDLDPHEKERFETKVGKKRKYEAQQQRQSGAAAADGAACTSK